MDEISIIRKEIAEASARVKALLLEIDKLEPGDAKEDKRKDLTEWKEREASLKAMLMDGILVGHASAIREFAQAQVLQQGI